VMACRVMAPPRARPDVGGAAAWNDVPAEWVSSIVDTVGPTDLVTVYWRPGCPYCAALRRGLRRAGLVTAEVNIWSDPTAVATVRSIAGGNETVPTVVVAGTGLVNPSVREIFAAVRAVAPDRVVDDRRARSSRRTNVLAVVQWSVIIALVVASFAVEAAGHASASWAVDGVDLVVYAGFRVIRRRLQSTDVPDTSNKGGTS
jgi:mycoredoxin